MIGLVALIVVGPQKLPEMMRTAGEWVGKLRRMTSDMRAQTGIDDILREEGIDGVAELRTLLRGERGLAARRRSGTYGYEAYSEPPDPAVEFPTEGPDANGALPDDLLVEDLPHVTESAPQPDPQPKPTTSASRPAAMPKAEVSQSAVIKPVASPKTSVPRQDSPKRATNSPPRPPSSRPPGSMPSSGKLPSSLPPPPTAARPGAPRAVTVPETPQSKETPRVVISEPPSKAPVGGSD